MEMSLGTQAAYTEGQIETAIAAAAAMLAAEISGSERDADLAALMSNTTLTLLCSPKATFAAVAAERYQLPSEEIKQWWSGWG